MLLHSRTRTADLLDRLETADARMTGQLEALTVWVAALVKSHPDGARLRATAQALSTRNPFRALCRYPEEVAAYDAIHCQSQSLALPPEPEPQLARRASPPPNV